jgi:hypothetical protein
MLETAVLAAAHGAHADEGNNAPTWSAGLDPAAVATLMDGAVVLLRLGHELTAATIGSVIIRRG